VTSSTARLEVVQVTVRDVPLLIDHLERHAAENGTGGDHVFMPFEPGTGPAVRERLDSYSARLKRAVGEPEWFRCFAVRDPRGFVAHADLKGSELLSMQHRCDLGIGVERAHRGAGMGSAMLGAAIAFCEAEPRLTHLDLGVFAHNEGAHRLYRAHGFVEIGRIEARFQLSTGPIDDILMTRAVG